MNLLNTIFKIQHPSVLPVILRMVTTLVALHLKNVFSAHRVIAWNALLLLVQSVMKLMGICLMEMDSAKFVKLQMDTTYKVLIHRLAYNAARITV